MRSRLVAWLSRVQLAWARRRIDAETRAEIDTHLERLAERYRREGMTPADAAAAARRQFGNVIATREELHTMNGLPWLESVWQDARLAVRVLRKDRTYTLTALLTLAICIGANATMFTVVRSVIFKPLPYPDAQRLVVVANRYAKMNGVTGGASIPDYFERKAAVAAFDELALHQRDSLRLGDDHGAERVLAVRGTPSLLRMLGVRPSQGRIFTDAEGEPGRANVVLISDGFWRSKFGGTPVLDRTIRINDGAYRIVGVLPPDFSFLSSNDVDVFLPRAFSVAERSDPRRRFMMIGRLRAGATPQAAQTQLDALNTYLFERMSPEARRQVEETGFETVVLPLRDELVAGVRPMLFLLWGGVGFVLIIGCVNLVNLSAVRAAGRTRELATRQALGGGFARVARQLVTESVVVCVTGGVLGLILGMWGLESIGALYQNQLPRGFEIGLDVTAILVVLAASVGLGVFLGLAPVIRLRGIQLEAALRTGGRAGTSERRTVLRRASIATAQFAIALVVLAGAALLFASFQAATRVELGFEPAGVSTVTVELPARYRTVPLEVDYVQRTIDALRAAPDVEMAAAAAMWGVPFTGVTSVWPLVADDDRRDFQLSLRATVSHGYFATMGMTLLRGRDFGPMDTAAAPPVVVVDDRTARMFWPGQDPVGKRLYYPDDVNQPAKTSATTKYFTVVGVVSTVQLRPPVTTDPQYIPNQTRSISGVVFVPYAQGPDTTIVFLARSRTGGDITGRMREIMNKNDLHVPVYQPRSMREWIDRAFVNRRAPMLVAMLFAGAALLLSAIGVYGVMAYAVSERRREIGIRLALGETTRGIFLRVLTTALTIVSIGLVTGLAGAFFVGRLLESFLYAVAPTSIAVLGSAALLLAGLVLAASLLPAWRASRINPVEVLER